MAGIYLHIPFCKQKCTYCDFHFSTTFDSYRGAMIQAMISEIKNRAQELNTEYLASIYFGGGTPSLLTSEELEEIFKEIRKYWKINTETEITLEANPDDITVEKVTTWVNAGINRLSVGIQSFDAEDLAWMNRAHTETQGLNCLQIAQENGIKNLSLDLIYGLPNMDVKRWKKQIEIALETGVQHISAYCLTVEEKTALHQWVKMKKINPASNEMQSEHFNCLIETVGKAGFEQYEISNFAKAGFYAKHNTSYWQGKSYLGIGPSAHSFDGEKTRKWNIANNQKYIQGITNENPFFEEEKLLPSERFNELILTGLRTKWGVSLRKLQEITSIPLDFRSKMKEFETKNWLTISKQQHIILTSAGKLMADHIASELFIVD